LGVRSLGARRECGRHHNNALLASLHSLEAGIPSLGGS
jgi:hypothetical protein